MLSGSCGCSADSIFPYVFCAWDMAFQVHKVEKSQKTLSAKSQGIFCLKGLSVRVFVPIMHAVSPHMQKRRPHKKALLMKGNLLFAARCARWLPPLPIRRTDTFLLFFYLRRTMPFQFLQHGLLFCFHLLGERLHGFFPGPFQDIQFAF